MTPAPAPAASSFPREYLERMRLVGDPPADDLIAKLIDDHGVSAANSMFSSLVHNEDMREAELPPAVREYLSATAELPSWADLNLIAAGERVFWRYGPRVILALHCYSLPFCYAGRNGVQVLALTGRLTGNPARRVIETAQMLVDILQPGGLTTPAGRGRRTLQKVRLMHAAVRRMAALAPQWKPEFGLPINQEDIAGTLMSFSSITLDGLAKLGIEIPAGDRQAYIHFWQVVGCQLGLRDNLNPGDEEAAAQLAEAVAQHQFAWSEEGVEMTAALVKYMQNALPGDALDLAPAVLIRYFLGKERAAMIGIGDTQLADLIARPIRLAGILVSDVVNSSGHVSRLAETMGRLLINSIVLIGRGGNRPSFRIPEELRQAWGVNWVS